MCFSLSHLITEYINIYLFSNMLFFASAYVCVLGGVLTAKMCL